jgi:two-component system CheB/CheR fusion protein
MTDKPTAKKSSRNKPKKRTRRSDAEPEQAVSTAAPRAGPAEGSGPVARSAPQPEAPANSPPNGFPIVGIGASAGGLEAFKQFLAAMPADSGMAFVLVPHLDPTHQSMMAELLTRQTAMPVAEAVHGQILEPNHVYIIPPNKYLAVEGGRLVLSAPPKPHWRQTAIDFALRSLAEECADKAIGIVLSGTGAHGTLGLKEIKLAGGLVMAQSPQSAEYEQMPRNAIATGIVDYVLPPQDMPAVLMDYVRHALTPDQAEAGAAEGPPPPDLIRILALLHARSKYDFRHYRKNMIGRRIRRRMGILRLDSMSAYLERLRHDPAEIATLCKDLLISVTSFFREPEAFEVLAERVLPELIAQLDGDVPLRVWVPGCATGEEAYTIAMLLFEQLEAADKPANIQIFATDIDDDSLETARQGVYPDGVTGAISEARLRRFFDRIDEHRYRVTKALREAVVFAPQNLITDAPFSRLHLISCRNVLIYLEPDIQAKIISLLHFALLDGGCLLLGPAESIGRAVDMFEPVSKKWRVFRRIGPARRDLVNIPVIAPAGGTQGPQWHAPPEPRRPAGPRLTELMQRAVAEGFAPASILIDRKYEILCLLGPVGDYLDFPRGELSRDLLHMARQGLRTKLRAACQKALREQHPVSDPNVRVKRKNGFFGCSMTVRPLTEPQEVEGLLLIVFQDHPDAAPIAKRDTISGEDSAMVEQLEDELRATREDLHGTIEELESSNEELKASNEEIMSMNEELQSANEELETSKEEMQSLNEELATVNSQLHDKVEDLDRESNDMANLMAATDIATVFLDVDLNIKRFTPATSRLLNLLGADIGRPFRSFAPKFNDETLFDDCERVLQNLQPLEKEIFSEDGRCYLRRIMPYRTADHRIAGVVIAFIDVTQRLAAEAQARRLATVLLESGDAVTVRDFAGRITGWNRGAEQLYGYTEAEALKMNMRDIADAEYCERTLDAARRVAAGERVESFEMSRHARDGSARNVWVTVTPLRDATGTPIGVATVEKNITARHEAEQAARELNATLERRIARRTAALEASEQRIRAVLDAAVEAVVTIDGTGQIETFNKAAERVFGFSAAEAIGQKVQILMPSPYREHHDEYLRRYRETGNGRVIGVPREFSGQRKDGTVFPIELSVSAVDQLGLFTAMIRDLTKEKSLQQEILQIATIEQRRIGQELHDGTQQELTGLGLLASNLSETLRDKQTPEAELAERLAAGIAAANANVRSLARGLLPGDVRAKSLAPALEELARTIALHHAVECRFECPEPVEIGDDVAAMHLYRIAQEAVTNAIKHAEAHTVTVRLRQRDEGLELEVVDDGAGIDRSTSTSQQGLGLRTMAHRCSLLGGKLTVEQAETGGTRIACRIDRTEELDVGASAQRTREADE